MRCPHATEEATFHHGFPADWPKAAGRVSRPQMFRKHSPASPSWWESPAWHSPPGPRSELAVLLPEYYCPFEGCCPPGPAFASWRSPLTEALQSASAVRIAVASRSKLHH